MSGSLRGAILPGDGGDAIDLNTLIAPGSGLTLGGASAVNDAGQIVGGAMTADGDLHAYLLTPVVPEPTCLSGMLLAVALLARRRPTA